MCRTHTTHTVNTHTHNTTTTQQQATHTTPHQQPQQTHRLNVVDVTRPRCARTMCRWFPLPFLLLVTVPFLVTVSAQSEGDLRLSGGPTAYEGRLEIYHSSVWGTVCSNSFRRSNLVVACAQLGFESGVNATFRQVNPSSTLLGEQGSGTIWLDQLICIGTETSLTQCSHLKLESTGEWTGEACTHLQDIWIECTLKLIPLDQQPPMQRAGHTTHTEHTNTREKRRNKETKKNHAPY